MSTATLYERMWEHDAYRRVAPGEHWAYRFVELAHPDSLVIDFGCGTGRGAALIHALTNQPVMALDFAANALDADVRRMDAIEFRQHDLREPVGVMAEYGYCTDVLEHIAPEDVDRVLAHVLKAARRVFFAISTVPDHFGPAIAGEPLHLTVRDAFWWHETLDNLGFRPQWSHYDEHTVCFWGSAYANGDDFVAISKLNEEHDRVVANIHGNLSLGLQEIVPHEAQPDVHVMLLAGGPSLADHEDEIVAAGRAGTPIVCVNGTYNWLLDRGIKPAAMVMVDARELNRRFVARHVDTCRYLVSSQVDHDLVASLPAAQTWLWHAGQSDLVKGVLTDWDAEHGTRDRFPVYGGTTVVTRAITLLAMLGFRKLEIFGWDSCLRGDEHHAYVQAENDGQSVIDVIVGGRVFKCHPWMVIQAHEVPKCVGAIWGKVPDLELSVRGDGLVAHILQHAAGMAERRV